MIQSIQEQHGIVGRTHELGDLLACIQAGRHVLLEGPVGVGKTAVAKAVAAALGRGFVRVDGDGRYTESRLVGQFDPPMVLEQGYKPEAFVAGENYFPASLQHTRLYEPVSRGLEIKVAEKLARLRGLNASSDWTRYGKGK